MSGNYARFLFTVAPSSIVEHPDDLSTRPGDIPDGPLDGWLAYAPDHSGDHGRVLGPFDPVVTRPYADGQPVIVADRGGGEGLEYLYSAGDDHHTGRPDRPCWYQSGATLRFIRKKC